jgi:hypothetical protein
MAGNVQFHSHIIGHAIISAVITSMVIAIVKAAISAIKPLINFSIKVKEAIASLPLD